MPGGSCQPRGCAQGITPVGWGALGKQGGLRGLGGPRDGQGTSAFPPLPVLLGKLRHGQAFPPIWVISVPSAHRSCASGHPEQSPAGTHRDARRDSHTHARSCAHSPVHTQTHSSQSPKAAADPDCLLAESRGWGTCASPPAPHQARAALSACTHLCPALAHLRVGSKPRNWGSSAQRRGTGGPGTGTMHPRLVTQAFV